jgi:formate/nitrite transporter FocA (FNT family)
MHTIENHRATIMRKTGAKWLSALARLALAAAGNSAGGGSFMASPAALVRRERPV